MLLANDEYLGFQNYHVEFIDALMPDDESMRSTISHLLLPSLFIIFYDIADCCAYTGYSTDPITIVRSKSRYPIYFKGTGGKNTESMRNTARKGSHE